MNASIINQANMTPQEQAYLEFVMSQTHILQKYKPNINVWFSRVGFNDEERVDFLEEAHGCILSTRIGANKMRFEREYLQFYHDMKQNES